MRLKDSNVYIIENQVDLAGYHKKSYDLNNNNEQYRISIDDDKIKSVPKIEKPKFSLKRLLCCCGKKESEDSGEKVCVL